MILVDTREKPRAIRNILEYFRSNGIRYKMKKLDYGDYMIDGHPEIAVDRKQTIEELAKNIGTADCKRFKRELIRSQEAGATLVILVEQNTYKDRGDTIKVEDISDLLRWSSKYSQVPGERVFRILAGWVAKYRFKVVFCSKRSTGRKIVEILTEGQIEAHTSI